MKGLRVLYVGQLWKGSTCEHRMNALTELGHTVVGVDTVPESMRARERSLAYRVRRKMFGPKDFTRLNERLLEALATFDAQILWLDKALTIRAATLERVKELYQRCVIVGYSPDDMINPQNQSAQFVSNLPLYDLFFTTKSFGVSELRALGCHRVEFVASGYESSVHRPHSVTETDRARLGGPVGFIGDYERQRAEMMLLLAQSGVPVRVWGPNWNNCPFRHPNLILEGRPIWGDEFARALSAFDINLAFLRRANRDQHTTRTFEIPGSGAFMLAERTGEHAGFFLEGKEAEFFGSGEELLEKVRRYLKNPDDRKRIAAAGRERCLTSGYSNLDRMKWMVARIESLTSNDYPRLGSHGSS